MTPAIYEMDNKLCSEFQLNSVAYNVSEIKRGSVTVSVSTENHCFLPM